MPELAVTKSTKRDKLYIEILRILCILLVIFNHTSNKGFLLFLDARESKLYWLYMFLSVACKVAVPVFFMISGALLLGKKESIQELYKKRVWKYVVILVVISLFYQEYRHLFKGAEINIAEWFKQIYSSDVTTPLWYLYSYIGMLIMLPILQKMVCSMENADYIYLAICYVMITGIIPVAQFYFSHGTITLNSSFSAPIMTAENIFYVLMGYYFEHVLDEKYYNKMVAMILAVASVCCIAVCCFMIQYKMNIVGELTRYEAQEFHSTLITIPTFAVYFCTRYLFMKISIKESVKSMIRFVGSTTFGIYLAEEMLRDRLLFVFEYFKPFIHTFPACLVYIFAVFFAGILILAILKKIPVIRKYI